MIQAATTRCSTGLARFQSLLYTCIQHLMYVNSDFPCTPCLSTCASSEFNALLARIDSIAAPRRKDLAAHRQFGTAQRLLVQTGNFPTKFRHSDYKSGIFLLCPMVPSQPASLVRPMLVFVNTARTQADVTTQAPRNTARTQADVTGTAERPG